MTIPTNLLNFFLVNEEVVNNTSPFRTHQKTLIAMGGAFPLLSYAATQALSGRYLKQLKVTDPEKPLQLVDAFQLTLSLVGDSFLRRIQEILKFFWASDE